MQLLCLKAVFGYEDSIMKKRNLKIAATACAMAGVLAVGGIMAYFTDGDTATNTFTVGKVSIDLQEPNWDPDDVTEITPEQDIQKDPQIKNDGINDAYVFIEVTVPTKNVVTANDDGSKNTAADTELFSWDVNPGWVQVGNVKENTEKDDDGNDVCVSHTYLYAYGTETAMTALPATDVDGTEEKENITATLFDYVRFANVVEDQNLEGTDLSIVVNAYAIQTTDINDGDTTIDSDDIAGKVAPDAVWEVLSEQAPSTTVSGTEDTKTDIKQ